jgi:imidazole glycerol-phosphate synthase subunit HisF
MLRPRIIPSLLIHQGGLVKTVEFKAPKYVGDPINAVKIFNEKEADELIVIDIDATVKGVEPNYKVIADLAAECRMPLCYGGGVKTSEQAKKIIGLGVEKIAISSAAIENPNLIADIAEQVGKQSVVVVLDVRKKKGLFSKGYELCTHNASIQIKNYGLLEFARLAEKLGAGELVLNSVDRDGSMNGYDLHLAKQIRSAVSIPLTMLGGAGSLEHLSELIKCCGVIGVAAGSLFVFKGKYKAVLINYPSLGNKTELMESLPSS